MLLHQVSIKDYLVFVSSRFLFKKANQVKLSGKRVAGAADARSSEFKWRNPAKGRKFIGVSATVVNAGPMISVWFAAVFPQGYMIKTLEPGR